MVNLAQSTPSRRSGLTSKQKDNCNARLPGTGVQAGRLGTIAIGLNV